MHAATMPQEVIATRTEKFQEAGNGLNVPKKSFNVESPSFTPKGPAPVQSPKIAGLSPRAAHAATFTPRGSGSVTPASSSHSKTLSNEFVPQSLLQSTQFAEFVPQNFVANAQSNQLNHQTDGPTNINPYSDPFLTNLDGTSGAITNPYAEHQPASNGQAYFQEASTFRHPLNYHLYAALGPHREQLAPYQRQTTDFFISDDLREDLQRKAEATLQTFPSSTVPQNVDNHFHSLVMLDSVAQRTSTTFGYPSWIYKATSSTDGKTYALRRIEGFRLTNEQAIGLKLQWKKVTCSSAVRVRDAFTTQAFGDRSLIIVMDYFPLSQTLADKHFPRNAGAGRAIQFVPEHELWSYLVQLGNALRAIHQNELAARSVVPSKVLLTSKNRLRLSGCCVLDILHYEQHRPTSELQQADLQDLGRLLLDIAARNPTAHTNPAKALDQISRNYTDRFRACLAWLLAPPNGGHGHASGDSSPDSSQYNVNIFLSNISDHVMNVFDSTLSRDDELTSTLTKETENGRLVRLLAKLNAILERSETNSGTSQSPNQPSNAWSETGDRYYLTLFRDYVFHQVDHDGRPVLNLGHIVTCLNKLDAGIDEKMQLVSRNEQSVFIVSYKELKRGFEAAWGELSPATILTTIGKGQRSLKNEVFGKKEWKSDKKTIFALTSEAAKWSEVLSEVVERSGVLGREKQLSPTLALVLTHDLLLSKKGIALPATHGLHSRIAAHRARLSAELTKARLRRGFATLDFLRASIDETGAASSDADGVDAAAAAPKPFHPRWIRINTLRTTLEEQLKTTFAGFEKVKSVNELRNPKAKLVYVDEHVPHLIAVPVNAGAGNLGAYREGKLIFQDKASCFPAYFSTRRTAM
nr:hypothetical protein B0A51_11556 [Rachicladosporium sp. CCFEE 5018]